MQGAATDLAAIGTGVQVIATGLVAICTKGEVRMVDTCIKGQVAYTGLVGRVGQEEVDGVTVSLPWLQKRKGGTRRSPLC